MTNTLSPELGGSAELNPLTAPALITRFPVALSNGTRLGPYEIVAPIGAGGMGHVYRARDTRLGRDVAVKVLPAELADNPQFKARFEREAQIISRLSHPHICALFDVGENYLVMEFLDGESLADKLARGPLAIHDVLKVGVQIAEALGKAHRDGVIHRDLKPGNIMMTPSGAKLLDFGLAKDRAVTSAAEGDATMVRALTMDGAIVGTFPYMAPEQLAGEEPDARSDVFSLGAVLYEMITGARAFQGASNRALIAAILTGEPQPIQELQPLVPPSLVHVVSRCLPKDPEDRWQSVADIAEELRWTSQAASQPSFAAPSVRARRSLRWVIAGATGWLLLLAAFLAAALYLPDVIASSRLFQTELGRSHLAEAFIAPLAMSRDGTLLACVSVKDGGWFLSVRNLRSGDTRILAGTQGATFPFWSSDARSIGFFASGKLKTYNLETSATQVICNAPDGRGASWNQHGVILFAPSLYDGLYSVPATGGTPVPVTRVTAGEKRSHRNPYFLPDGDHFLFSAVTGGNATGGATLASSLEGATPRKVLDYASTVAYSDGYLFSVRDGALVAHKFAVDSAAVTGPPTMIGNDVDSYAPRGTASFAVAGNVVVYSPAFRPMMRFALAAKNGRLEEYGETAMYKVLHVSPDGHSVSSNRFEESQRGFDLVLMDLSSGTASRRISSGRTGESNAVFSPDGARVVVDDNVGDAHELWTQSVSGGARESLVKGAEYLRASDWSRDGNVIVFDRQRAGTGWDIEYVRMDGDKHPVPVVNTTASENSGRLSPDQRWLAFVSDEGGNSDVYVTSFPSAQGKWRISSSGGTSPRWSADGRTLHYLVQGTIKAVDVRDGPRFATGPPYAIETFGSHVYTFDVMRDERIIALRRPDEPPPPLNVIVNWRELLSRN